MTEKLNWGLYIGQRVVRNGEVFELIGVSDKVLYIKDFCDEYGVTLRSCKPILRSLNQITDEEKIEFGELFLDGACLEHITVENYFVTLFIYPYSYNDSDIRMIDWLTAKGFSIRGEFENGLAIKEENK